VAFCLGLRFALEVLRFVSEDLAFCLKRSCVLSLEDLAFCLGRSCVLSSKILRFTSEALRFVYFQDLAFCLRNTAFCLQRLLFALEELRFVFKDLAFCLGSTASRFLRYIDTRPNGDAIRKCILSCPYKPTTVLVQAVAATDDSPAIPEHTTVETPMNIKFTSHDGETMESYYTRFYKLMNEMIQNNLIVATMQVNVQFLQQLQPEWSRFVTIVKQQHKLDEISYHKLFDILKQYQKEVNELRAERLARNANPLALVATAQANQDPYYQTSKSHKSHAPSSKPSIPTRSHTTTRYKGKEIAKPITPPSETAPEEESDPEQAQRDKDMQKNLALIAKFFKKIYKPTNNNLRTSSNSKNKNECRKPKRVKDSAYHKENILMCKQAEQGVPLQAEQYDWLADTDEEIDEQELEAHYSYMAKIQEVPTADSGTDSEPLE
nr:hypothetical protein [Tanacetum cinerariifolium]